jgi:hypothetical protein
MSLSSLKSKAREFGPAQCQSQAPPLAAFGSTTADTFFSLPGRQHVETPGRAVIFSMQQVYHLAGHKRYWPVSRHFLTLGPDPLPFRNDEISERSKHRLIDAP